MVHKRAFVDIPWHEPSDQPHALTDRTLQRRLRKESIEDYLRQLGTIGMYGGFAAGHYARLPRKNGGWVSAQRNPVDCVGIACDPAAAPANIQAELLTDLGIRQVLMRIGVWQDQHTSHAKRLVRAYPQAEYCVCVMQNRKAVGDPIWWYQRLEHIVQEMWPLGIRCFQIGQAVNRGKWGCFQIGEFFSTGTMCHAFARKIPRYSTYCTEFIRFRATPASTLILSSSAVWL